MFYERMWHNMKKLLPLLWLLIVPVAAATGFLFMRLGAFIDTAIFSNSAGNGHGIPIFSFVFLIIAGIVFIISLIAAVILTIRGFVKNGGK